MHLKQPTREQRGPRIMSPYLVLLRVGFTMPQTVTCCAVRSYRTISPLPVQMNWRFIFCCTFRRLSPPRRYLALCPVEPGLSSPDFCLARSPDQLPDGILHYNYRIKYKTAQLALLIVLTGLSKKQEQKLFHRGGAESRRKTVCC